MIVNNYAPAVNTYESTVRTVRTPSNSTASFAKKAGVGRNMNQKTSRITRTDYIDKGIQLQSQSEISRLSMEFNRSRYSMGKAAEIQKNSKLTTGGVEEGSKFSRALQQASLKLESRNSLKSTKTVGRLDRELAQNRTFSVANSESSSVRSMKQLSGTQDLSYVLNQSVKNRSALIKA